jgi:hypothetical protein
VLLLNFGLARERYLSIIRVETPVPRAGLGWFILPNVLKVPGVRRTHPSQELRIANPELLLRQVIVSPLPPIIPPFVN